MKILRETIEKRLNAARVSEPYFKTHEVVEKRVNGKLVRVEKYIGCNTTYLRGASNLNQSSSARCDLEVRSNYKKVNRWENLKSQERYALNK